MQEQKKESPKIESGQRAPQAKETPKKPLVVKSKVKKEAVDDKTKKDASKTDSVEIQYEYFDGGDHWCRSCNRMSSNVFDMFSHLQSTRHQQVSQC